MIAPQFCQWETAGRLHVEQAKRWPPGFSTAGSSGLGQDRGMNSLGSRACCERIRLRKLQYHELGQGSLLGFASHVCHCCHQPASHQLQDPRTFSLPRSTAFNILYPYISIRLNLLKKGFIQHLQIAYRLLSSTQSPRAGARLSSAPHYRVDQRHAACGWSCHGFSPQKT